MPAWIKSPVLIWSLVAVTVFGLWKLDQSHQRKIGYAQAVAEMEKSASAQARVDLEEKQRADALFRGAVAAREVSEKKLAASLANGADLLRQLKLRSPAPAKTGSGTVGTGDDWISILGACYADYGWLGGETARIADKLYGLRVYTEGVVLRDSTLSSSDSINRGKVLPAFPE